MTNGRRVTLVVVDEDGELRGQLPPFAVETPWWQDLQPILDAHPDVVVLRLLAAAPPPGERAGGDVAYLVQADGAAVHGHLDAVAPGLGEAAHADDERRAPWARPGGPQADLAWAARYVVVDGRPVQHRSWNLSSIWELPADGGRCWLKCVPPFFAHEAAVLQRFSPMAPAAVPELLAADGHRMLLADMPGRDGYGAGPDEYRAMVDVLLGLQAGALEDGEGWRRTVPDWRPPALRARISAAIGGRHDRFLRLQHLLDDGWDDRMAAVDRCGVPDTVFHGDLHPGNARVGTTRPVLFDWGDSGFGHPLLDVAAVERYELGGQSGVRSHWMHGWRELVPGCDPGRAWQLLRPVALARAGAVFRLFVDHIEASEAVYHEGDIDPALDAAEAALADDGAAGGGA